MDTLMANARKPNEALAISDDQIDQFLEALERVSIRRTIARDLPPPDDGSIDGINADFAYRLLGTLLGRTGNAFSSAIAAVERTDTALTVELIDARSGESEPAPAGTLIELSFDGAEPIDASLDQTGAVELPEDVRSKVITGGTVRDGTSRIILAVTGRVEPPAKSATTAQDSDQTSGG